MNQETPLCITGTLGCEDRQPEQLSGTVALSFDATPMITALNELGELASCLGLTEVVKSLLHSLDATGNLLCIESDVSPTIAGNVIVVCKPSERLFDLVAALRAGDINLFVGKIDLDGVSNDLHGVSSCQ